MYPEWRSELEVRAVSKDHTWVYWRVDNRIVIGGVSVHNNDLGTLFKVALDGLLEVNPAPVVAIHVTRCHESHESKPNG